jgi:dienelactone hydrolase
MTAPPNGSARVGTERAGLRGSPRQRGNKMPESISRTKHAFLDLLFACIFVAAPFTPAAPLLAAENQLAEKAHHFAERFMAGDFENVEPQYTPEMKAAMTQAKSAQLRDALVAQNGPLSRVGDAWFEDKVQGYVRYRVPLFFENAAVDMRIVFDAEQRVAGMWIVQHTSPPPQTEPPGEQVDVTVADDNRGLPGTLTLPAGGGPFPAAILVHGSGPNDRDETIGPNKPFRELAWGLAKRGIATLRYDKRSFARREDLLALGESLTVREEVIDDALAGLALLGARPEIDPQALFIIGHSLGGTLAPRIAEEAPRIAGIVVLAGSTLPLPEKILEQTRYIASLDGVVSPEEQKQIDEVAEAVSTIRAGLEGKSVRGGYLLGVPLGYYRDLEDYDAPSRLASSAIPCLVLQGGRDYQVTLEDFARWQDALATRPDACLHVFDGLDHLFRAGTGPSGPGDYDVYKPLSEEVVDCIAQWIELRRCCDTD